MSRNKSQGFDEQLKTAYEQALYCIDQPAISWEIGVKSPALEHLLTLHKADTAIFVTAANPYSQIYSPKENRDHHQALEKWIKENQLIFFKGRGEDPQGEWPPEESFLILGLNAEEGIQLGRHWQQNAVVLFEIGLPPTLLWCKD